MTGPDDLLPERGRVHVESRRAETLAVEPEPLVPIEPEPRRPWLHALILLPVALVIGIALAYLFNGAP